MEEVKCERTMGAQRKGGGRLKLGGEDPSLIRTLGEVRGLREQSPREWQSLRWQQSFSKPCHSCLCGGVFHRTLRTRFVRALPGCLLHTTGWSDSLGVGLSVRGQQLSSLSQSGVNSKDKVGMSPIKVAS